MERFRKLREERGLSIPQLSRMTGVLKATLVSMETKENRMLTNIEQVAGCLGVNPAYLCGWIDSRDGAVQVVEKIVKVKVYKPMERIPDYWKADENGQLIRWMRGGKPI